MMIKNLINKVKKKYVHYKRIIIMNQNLLIKNQAKNKFKNHQYLMTKKKNKIILILYKKKINVKVKIS